MKKTINQWYKKLFVQHTPTIVGTVHGLCAIYGIVLHNQEKDFCGNSWSQDVYVTLYYGIHFLLAASLIVGDFNVRENGLFFIPWLLTSFAAFSTVSALWFKSLFDGGGIIFNALIINSLLLGLCWSAWLSILAQTIKNFDLHLNWR